MNPPTTSPSGYSSFQKEESWDTIDYQANLNGDTIDTQSTFNEDTTDCLFPFQH